MKGRTFSQLREVSGKARREEIARMLGGQSAEAMRLAATMVGENIDVAVGGHSG
jgi:DNA repair ATPase RecN